MTTQCPNEPDDGSSNDSEDEISPIKGDGNVGRGQSEKANEDGSKHQQDRNGQYFDKFNYLDINGLTMAYMGNRHLCGAYEEYID